MGKLGSLRCVARRAKVRRGRKSRATSVGMSDLWELGREAAQKRLADSPGRSKDRPLQGEKGGPPPSCGGRAEGGRYKTGKLGDCLEECVTGNGLVRN